MSKDVFTLFELFDEDIIEATPSFKLIDEENDDESYRCRFCLFYVRNFINAPSIPPSIKRPLKIEKFNERSGRLIEVIRYLLNIHF